MVGRGSTPSTWNFGSTGTRCSKIADFEWIFARSALRVHVNSLRFCIAPILLMNAGNDNLHLMTFFKRQVLRIELGDWENNKRYAKYDNFRVGSEHMQYKLISLGNYRGNAGQYDCRYSSCWHCPDFSLLHQLQNRIQSNIIGVVFDNDIIIIY